jgi:hypothetical protein
VALMKMSYFITEVIGSDLKISSTTTPQINPRRTDEQHMLKWRRI